MKQKASAIPLRPRAARAAAFLVIFAIAACDEGPAPDDAEAPAGAALEEGELDLTVAEEGRVEGTIVVDGETIIVSVESSESVRELSVSGLDEYARWVYDTNDQLTVGHIDGHTFGRFEDRFHSLDRDYWDEMRSSRAAAILPVVSEAAWQAWANADVDDATKAALHDVSRIVGYVENLGTVPPEFEGEEIQLPTNEDEGEAGWMDEAVVSPDFDLTATTDPAGSCYSHVSNAGHSIDSVQVFQTGCRINHRSFTTKPSGGCNFSRCVRHYNSGGGSASSAYCNNPGQTLNQAHVVPRSGGSYGLWSHHWAPGTPLDAWYWREATCPA